MQRMIDNVCEKIRDMMNVFEEFKSMGIIEQLLRAPEFEQRLAKAEEAIKQAEDYIMVSFISQRIEDSYLSILPA